MIAKVRIAPVENWCERTIKTAKAIGVDFGAVVGETVWIITQSMACPAPVPQEQLVCKANSWLLTTESSKALFDRAGVPHRWQPKVYFCEHMLEMD